MDSNRIRLCGNIGFGLVGRGEATFRKVVFSLRKVELAVKKEANCCRCDSCLSFSIRSNNNSLCSSVDLEPVEGISPIEQVGSELPVVFAAAKKSMGFVVPIDGANGNDSNFLP